MEGLLHSQNRALDQLSELEGREAPPVDAVVRVSVSKDELKAVVILAPPSNGGVGPSLKAIMAELAKYNVTYQVDVEGLERLAANPVYQTEIVVSRGVPPVNGVDGSANILIRTEKLGFHPKTDERGVVDYRNLDLVENVVRGQTLCTITPPTKGTPGISVRGQEIPPRAGKPAPSYLGRNTQLNETGTEILAKIDGQVEFRGQQIHVEETFYVQGNVDHSVGNLQVNGNLVVRDMVLSGFELQAAGKIEVEGTVVNATIKAGGDLKLHGGITGGEARSGGNCTSKYIENSRVFVTGSIRVESIVNSDVKCGKSITVSGPIARIMGGSCTAGENIEASCIGSRANIKTRLELGADPTVMERQQKLLTHVKEMEDQNKKLTPLLKLLQQLEEGNRLTPDKEQALENSRYTYETNMQMLEQAHNELEEITQAIRTRGFGRILCSSTMYPGTQVIIGSASQTITDALDRVSLSYKDGEICVGPMR